MDKFKLEELRKRAKDRLRTENYAGLRKYDDNMDLILHDLSTYQIELELQNEELRRVQRELEESRDQYMDLYDFAPIGYLTVNDKNIIVEANLTASGLLGMERQLLVDRPFSNFVKNEDQDILYKLFRGLGVLSDRQSCNLRIQKKEGDWFWAKLEGVSRAKNEKGGFCIRIAFQDITEAMRMESEIMKVNKLESTALLAGGIAHDFNNLLAVILGNLEIIQTDLSEGRPVDKSVQDAEVACLRAAELTKKFLTFSSGGEPFKTIVSAKTFITESVSKALGGSTINFECHLSDNLWALDIDTGQMTQALGNVITNSMESMSQGGLLRICAENVDSVPEAIQKLLSGREEKYVKITIEDQGLGIHEDFLPNIFDPYFSSKKMGQEKGLGLGLTIAYSIIKKHSGFIDIESQLNIGTTVSIYLPASDTQLVLQQQILPQKALALNKKILVMDDEEMLRDISRHLLEALGYEVQVACDGEEAVQKYSKAQLAGVPFGAVILDLTIKGSGMGGKETIKCLKKLNPNVRALVASGYSNDPIMSNWAEYGFVEALQKPYQMKDLEKSMEKIYEGWKSEQKER